MNTVQRQALVESWVAQEQLPAMANLKPIREFDDLYPEDEDERTAYFDFLHWYITLEHQTLFSIPSNTYDGFNKIQLDERGDDISAFNTIDYNRKHPFNVYNWQLKKACEQTRDWAITYSVIQDSTARLKRLQRFIEFANTKAPAVKIQLWAVWQQHAYSK